MRTRRRPLALLLSILVGAAVAALAARTPLVTVSDKPATVDRAAPAPPPVVHAPLPLRMVDAGAVGIVADTGAWGHDYLHATHAFHLFVDSAPWVDDAATSRTAAEWSGYVQRMTAYGNNAIALELFLQLVTFDSLDAGAVYAATPVRRLQHAALRRRLQAMLREAGTHGMRVLLQTDLPAYTTPLRQWQRRQPGGDDPGDPRFWRPFAAALEELFRELPELHGAVVRIGEAGPLYHDVHWDFWSRFGVTEPAHLRTMLGALLPVFERHRRVLVLRTWSVGVRGLGDLHHDPAAYRRALGDIHSPSLVLSTKFVDFDFFGVEPLNPTLATGDHPRLVEFQARREFEGFGALPNYLGATHARALAQLRASNPRIEGTWLWTQSGGPPRAGPLLLYPRAGPWRWNDATVFATSRLARDPSADPRQLAHEWARTALGADDTLAAIVADVAMRTRPALLEGLYILPYAERRVSFAGRRLPTLLWVYEWDVVGGASAPGSVLYAAVRDRLPEAIAGGQRAVDAVRSMRDTLRSASGRFPQSADYRELDAAFAYEESLFLALARYREWLLSHYRWLDTGDPDAASAARRVQPLLAAVSAHEIDYARALDFPAFDFRFVRAELARAARAPIIAWLARLLLGTTLLLAVGARHLAPGSRPAASVLPAVLLPALGLGAVTSFDSAPLVLGAVVVGATAVLALYLAWHDLPDAGGAVARAVAPAWMLGAMLLLACSWRGPMQAWFLVWTSDLARALLLGGIATSLAWLALAAYVEARHLALSRRGAVASALLAGGTSVLAGALLLPPLPISLAALFEPLGLLPVRLSLQLALQEYVGIPAAASQWFTVLGAALLLLGWWLWRRARRNIWPE